MGLKGVYALGRNLYAFLASRLYLLLITGVEKFYAYAKLLQTRLPRKKSL